MPARDANDATWYVLRYPEDFRPRVAGPGDPSPPRLEPTLHYDEGRGVLELVPGSPEDESEPAPGVVVDIDGDVYRVVREGELVVVHCDGSEEPVACDPGVMAGPRGLALDGRGLLYLADARARRIVVLDPGDGTVRALLHGDLEEPVDVAVDLSGRVYAADRAGRAVRVWDAAFRSLGKFVPRSPDGFPAVPRPIAVTVDDDGAVLVADARHPRLLRFAPGGTYLGDVVVAAPAADDAEAAIPLAALRRVYGDQGARFVAGVCGPCAPANDGRRALVAAHRAIRLLALRLARSFAREGTFVSAALDGGLPGTTWHKVEVDADVPAGTSLTVETATAEQRQAFDPATASWAAPLGPAGAPAPFTTEVPDQLVQSPPGRWLWARVRLRSGGLATPALRALTIRYPRVSYLDLLPRVYRRDPDGTRFLERYLALFERILTGLEDRYERFGRELDPAAAPPDVLAWLACLIDLVLDPTWRLDRRRALVMSAMDLYRRRGTPEGLRRYVEVYTGTRPVIVEAFLAGSAVPSVLGRSGAALGCELQLAPARGLPPAAALRRARAHRFSVYVYLDNDCEEAAVLAVVDRIVTVNKPAHTIHELVAVRPGAQVGMAAVGIDFLVGGQPARPSPLPGCPIPGEPPAERILGRRVILTDRRPAYVRPILPVLS
jgi:phage tail-like protein